MSSAPQKSSKDTHAALTALSVEKKKPKKKPEPAAVSCLMLLILVAFIGGVGYFAVKVKTPGTSPATTKTNTIAPGMHGFSGQVVDEKKRPVKKALVFFQDTLVVTDESGRFNFSYPASGNNAELVVRHPDYPSSTKQSVALKGKSTSNIVVVMKKSGGGSTATGFDGREYSLWMNASWDELNRKVQALSGKKMQIIKVSSYKVGGSTVYAGLWHKSNDASSLWSSRDTRQFEERSRQLADQGYHLIDIDVAEDNGRMVLVGIAQKSPGGANQVAIGLDWDQLMAKSNDIYRDDYRLTNLEPFTEKGQIKYAAIWETGYGETRSLDFTSRDEFSKKWKKYQQTGLHLVDLEIFRTDENIHYLGLWRQGEEEREGELLLNASWSEFDRRRRDLDQQGLILSNFATIQDGKSLKISGVWGPLNPAPASSDER